jgi:hypothetical protein
METKFVNGMLIYSQQTVIDVNLDIFDDEVEIIKIEPDKVSNITDKQISDFVCE